MGSDSVRKSTNLNPKLLNTIKTLLFATHHHHHHKQLSKATVKLVLFISIFVFLILCLLYNSYSNIDNKASIIPPLEIQQAKKSIPKRCHSTLDKIINCQRYPKSKETIVFACHRKWCNSFYGHCEIVNGIGDRTKHMLSMFSDASLDKCLRVELDYPQEKNGVLTRFDDFEYVDKWGYIAELLHFRSYDVSDLKVNVHEWGRSTIIESQHDMEKDDISGDERMIKKENKKTFVHFIPSQDQYQFHKYDPCLYHILFKSTSILETEVQYYSQLFGLDGSRSDVHDQGHHDVDDHDQHGPEEHKSNNVLGMHFRTGDLVAFGLKNNDVRTSSRTLISSYNKMIECAQSHAQSLGLQPDNRTGKIKIFLATDNQIIKDRARNDDRVQIYMTEDKPAAYVRTEGDRSAYTDLYLLSKTRGLVVNELPDQYEGRLAEKVSTFAQLAMNIGFMEEKQLYRCKLLE